MAGVPTGRKYMIDGFEIPVVRPATFDIVFMWKNGVQTRWGGRTPAEAVECMDKISLRPDLMQRVEVREGGADSGQALWDADWPVTE